MKHIVVPLIILALTLGAIQTTTATAGNLELENGNRIQFEELRGAWNSLYSEDQTSRSYSSYHFDKEWPIFFKGTVRCVPFGKLEFIRVVRWESWGRNGAFSTIDAKTDTGITLTDTQLLSGVSITTLDELTGEVKELYVRFLSSEKMNIRSIIF